LFLILWSKQQRDITNIDTVAFARDKRKNEAIYTPFFLDG